MSCLDSARIIHMHWLAHSYFMRQEILYMTSSIDETSMTIHVHRHISVSTRDIHHITSHHITSYHSHMYLLSTPPPILVGCMISMSFGPRALHTHTHIHTHTQDVVRAHTTHLALNTTQPNNHSCQHRLSPRPSVTPSEQRLREVLS